VALKHYLQNPTDDDYRKVTQCPSESALLEQKAETADAQKGSDLPQDSEAYADAHK